MIIHYSPLYDGEIFINDSTDLMGVSYVGTQGLLGILQLRAGLHRNVKSAVEREADYMRALRLCITGSMFEKAFNVDEIGVAGKLLQWRDHLLMAGWNGKCSDVKARKLAILADVEKNFSSCGVADCWVEVCREYEKCKIIDNCIKEFVVECPQSEMPPVVRKTFAAIESFGTAVKWTAKDDANIPPIEKEKIKILEFEELYDAYEWIARVDKLPPNTVVINRDNSMLNNVLYTWNRPQVHSTVSNSNPQFLQLFKLGISVFSRPLNIANLISYLQLPISPIPSALRYKLTQILIDNGGFGDKKTREDGAIRDDWEQAIHCFEFLNKDGVQTPLERKKKMAFLAPIRNDYSLGIEKSELSAYLSVMKMWINNLHIDKDMPEERLSQVHELQTFVSSLETSLEALPSVIEYAEIDKLVRQIYRPMSYALQQSETGAMKVIDEVYKIATPADTLIWLDCQDERIESNPYDFLSLPEQEYLKSTGVVIPDFSLHLQTRRREMYRHLADVKKNIILVCSAYNGTTRLGEHSLLAEIKQQFEKLPIEDRDSLFDMFNPTPQNGDIETYAPVKYIDLDREIKYEGRRESYSSLDTLIHLPFNYFMKYVAKLYEPNSEQMKECHTVIGLIAHNFFEHIIADSKGDFDKMRRLTEDEFEQRLENSIDATGLIMRLPENASRLNSFSVSLKDSMLALVDIMQHLKLSPVGCEISLLETGELRLEDIGSVNARIDFLLNNENGEYVVFDFKWSHSKDYHHKLEKNIAIQLELYRQAVEKANGAKVAAVGYYMMPLKQLFTCDYDDYVAAGSNHKLINRVESLKDRNLFKQIRNAYKFRIDEIRNGRIEEGEMQDFLNTDNSYYSQHTELNLCPLDIVETYDNPRIKNKVLVAAVKNSEKVYKSSKKRTYNNGNNAPSETATSYAILKGRLK